MRISLNNCVKYTKVSHSEYLFIFSKLNIKSKTLSKTLIYHNLTNSSTNNWPNLQSVKSSRFRSLLAITDIVPAVAIDIGTAVAVGSMGTASATFFRA